MHGRAPSLGTPTGQRATVVGASSKLAAELLGIPGLLPTKVRDTGDGWPVVEVVTDPGIGANRCPICQREGHGSHPAPGLPVRSGAAASCLAETTLVLRQHGVSTGKFYQVAALDPATGHLTCRLRDSIGQAIDDGVQSVRSAASKHHMSQSTAAKTLAAYGARQLRDLAESASVCQAAGIDEFRRGDAHLGGDGDGDG